MRDRGRFGRKRSARPFVVVGTIVTLAVLLPVAASAVDAKSKGPAGCERCPQEDGEPGASPRRVAAAPRHRAGADLRQAEEGEGAEARPAGARAGRPGSGRPVERGHCRRAGTRPRHRGRRPGLQRPGRHVHRQLGAARHERRRRPEPLRRDRQRELRDLQQVGHAGLRAGADEHALERLRRRLPDQQRRRRDGRVRPARRPLDHHPVLRQHDAVPAVRRRLARPATRPARTTATRSSTRTSPTTRSSACGRTPTTSTYNMFNANGTSFLGAEVCAFDRAKMLAGAGRDAAVLQRSARTYGGLLPADLDGPTPPPAGAPNYLLALRHERAAALEVPRRLDDAGEHDAHRADDDPRRRVLAGVQRRRHLHPAAGHDAEARLARRPADVPAGLPQLRRPRVARRQPQRHRGQLASACAGTSCATRTATPTRLPAGHLRARRDATAGWAAIAMDHAATSRSATASSSSTLAPGHPLHRPARRRPARHDDAGRGDDRHRRRLADRRPAAAGATTRA